MRAELGWIGECLGTVRDIDVLAARVTAATDGLPEPLRLGATATLGVLTAERGPPTSVCARRSHRHGSAIWSTSSICS